MKYFETPFAEFGDKTPIPDAVQPSGSVSYTQGFPVKYSTPVDSGGLEVPRDGFNELYYQITLALQQYQEYGVPDYFTAIGAGGSGYAINSIVRYSNDVVYMSLVSSNTAVPGTDPTKWMDISDFGDLAFLGIGAGLYESGGNLAARNVRETLPSARNYYVATTGSNSNNGLTVGTPFLTIQYAIDYVANNIDLAGYNCTINVADGTYSTGVTILSPFVGKGVVTLLGNTTTPANCIISGSSNLIEVFSGANLSIRGFKLITTVAAGGCIRAYYGALININGNMDFGSVSGAGSNHMVASEGGEINITSNYAISGGATLYHILAQRGGIININSNTITISGTPAFSGFIASSDVSLIIAQSLIFSGSATGARYQVVSNSVINTNGGGASYFPGNSAGATATGGQYI